MYLRNPPLTKKNFCPTCGRFSHVRSYSGSGYVHVRACIHSSRCVLMPFRFLCVPFSVVLPFHYRFLTVRVNCIITSGQLNSSVRVCVIARGLCVA